MCRVLSRAGYTVDLATYPFGDDLDLPGLRIHRALKPPGILTVPIGFSLRKLVLDASLALLVAWLPIDALDNALKLIRVSRLHPGNPNPPHPEQRYST